MENWSEMGRLTEKVNQKQTHKVRPPKSSQWLRQLKYDQ